MIINHNISALFVNRVLSQNERELLKSIEKLSSGERINRAADDASGLAVSETLRAQIKGLKVAQRNVMIGISFVQTAEGALQEVNDILQRLRELAVQAANSVYTPEDRAVIQVEISQLVAEVSRITGQAEFNKYKLFSGEQSNFVFQIGPNKGQALTLPMKRISTSAMGISGLSVSSPQQANVVISKIDKALGFISGQRALYGAYQNRFEHVLSQIEIAEENFQAAESRIRDTDIAEEMVNYLRLSILEEAGIAMLTQANLKPETVLRILD